MRASPLLGWLAWQAPGWVVVGLLAAALVVALDLPAWLIALVVAAAVAKDLLLYPAMRATLRPGRDRLVGSRARAVEPLAPRGYVRLSGQLWQAEAASGSIGEGAEVVVRQVRGLTLVVEPARSGGPPPDD
ncbi:MAG TPA: NfeD family protein [Candidatus Tectomicrobia bacterium]|nr:NfeD family protein [Candidatus Tectomicrobia bacterium]